MTDISSLSTTRAPWRVVLLVGLILFIELTLIGTLFKHRIDFDCLANWPQPVCRGASRSLVSIYCLLGATVLLYMLRPAALQALVTRAGQNFRPMLVNLAGVVVALVPLTFLNGAQGTSTALPSFAFWSLGMVLMLTGTALTLAPLTHWRTFIAENWSALLPTVAVAVIAPPLAMQLQPIWSIDWIADQTFGAVVKIMQFTGYDLITDVENKVIGVEGFAVRIANVCSGIEGIALVTLFVTLYLWLFRKDLRFPLAFVLYPLGIMASVAFNILRIALLLYIGLEGNPELAVGGFHSHAGWMMFTLVALGVIALAQTVPALRKDSVSNTAEKGDLPPFFQDPMVALILPFAVFMFSALIASTLSQTPSLIYPIRAAVMTAALVLVWPYFKTLPWRIDPIAVAVGAFIAAYWVLIPVEAADATAPYGALTGGALMLWFVARGIGTTILVPIIEEAFFRGYLEQRLRLGTGTIWIIAATVASAVLFAALHGRWAEAFVASLLFSWVALRRGSFVDAIVAHGVANGLIFAAAVATGNLAMI